MITRIEKLSELLDINVAFWVYSRSEKSFQYISPGVKNIFETDIEKITDIKVFRKIVHPDDQTKVLRNLNGGYSGSTDEVDYRIITAQGKIKWLKNTAITVKDHGLATQHVIGCTYIRSKNKTLPPASNPGIIPQAILRALPDSFLILNTKGKIIQAQMGRNERFVINKTTNQLKGKTIGTVLNRLLSKKIKEKLNTHPFDVRALSFETEIGVNSGRKWVEVRMQKIQDDAVFVIIRHITELLSKINEIEKFYNITEQSQELVMITDVTGTIEYINPMVTKTTGYTRQELVGKKASIFKSGKHPETFYVELWRTILKGKSFKTEFNNIKKNGSHYVEEKIITPLLNINGQITNFISTGRDVTLERRKQQMDNKYRKLEVTLHEKEQKTRTLSLIKSDEIEREKFAREIHEGVNQMLSAAVANLESLTAKNIISDDEKTKLEFINQMVSEITNELRGISTNLSPIGLYEFGLFPIIVQKVKRINARHSHPMISFTSNTAGMRFKNEVEINIYRIIQEALENIMKHANAQKINLTLDHTGNNLVLQIKDNGKGINMNNLEFKKMSTFGILNIEARAKSIGAALSIRSGKDKGFMINLSLHTKKLIHG
jgi:two-component system sensor histidine kinase NreB